MISPDEALQTILNIAQRLPPINISIGEALDKVLAEDIRAPDPLPPFPPYMKGFDIEKDTVVLKSGERLGAAEIGLLTTVGVVVVKVYLMPVIAVLSTGGELVEPTTESLGCGQIRDSNRAMMLAAATQHQCKVLDLGIAPDDEKETKRILDGAFSSGIHIILTSGGVSIGDKDYIKPLLENRGKVYFDKVCMKPGKPFTFAEIVAESGENTKVDKILAFGLPGNPESFLVCFHLFVIPSIRHVAGWENPCPPRVLACLKHSIETDAGCREFHLAIVRWEAINGLGNQGFVAESTGHQISSRLLSLKSANALLEIPASGNLLSAGASMTTIIISGLLDLAGSMWSSPVSSQATQPVISQVTGNAAQGSEMVVLTVSDTISLGSGTDIRYSAIFVLAALSYCWFWYYLYVWKYI